MRHHDVDSKVDALASRVMDVAIDLHRALGPGLRERYYRDCLLMDLKAAGIHVEKNVRRDLVYKGHLLPSAVEFDVIVEDTLLLELKAVDQLHPEHWMQARSYVRFGRYPLGIIINFHAVRLVDGWHRVLPGTFPEAVACVAPSRRRIEPEPVTPP